MRFAVLPVAVAALALAGCDLGPVAPESETPRGKGRTCYVVDISGSTAAPRFDGNYRRTLFVTAAANATRQSGQLCFTFAAGGSVRGALVAFADVAPDHPDNSDLAPGEILRKVSAATQSLDRTLTDPPPHTAGSQLLLAVYALARRADLRPGDEVVFLSDMHERSEFLRVDRDDTFDAGIIRVLNALRKEHLLPNLEGVTVRVPHVNERGRIGPDGRIIDDSSITPGRLRRVQRFWELYADATGATLTEKLPDAPIKVPAWVTQPRG